MRAREVLYAHVQILKLHTDHSTNPICRSTFPEQYKTPLPKHNWDMHIVAIWNTEDRNCLNARNKNSLKGLAKEIPEAKWEINYFPNDPYPSILSPENTPGLTKVRKLPSDHLHQTPQGPQDKNSTMDPPQSSDDATQHSFSPNLVRKVQDWREWAYTDGSLKEHKEKQDTGSGVYYPCLNVSHHVNSRGVGIINTTSRAELAAIAAAIIHGYSHIATVSLTSMHQMIKTALI